MKNKDIPKLIKELRNKLGLTQEQFAQKVGVTFPTINNWERGTRIPHPFLFQRLLEIAEEAGLKNIQNIKRTKK
ncbi:MAG: transcriptional regulator [Thermodesulfobacteriota bacterium]|nr:helix-turn-helix transcriptional regulator [Candidatus Desulfofervidus auxilii]RKX66817.1 MAG: transcriptional regulator [Thermodesulfobacteriota bacterium]